MLKTLPAVEELHWFLDSRKQGMWINTWKGIVTGHLMIYSDAFSSLCGKRNLWTVISIIWHSLQWLKLV